MKPRTYECDLRGRLRLHYLLKHFQEAASEHADKMGLGMKWVIANRYSWVLVNMRLNISSMPGWNKDTTLYTFPSGYDEMKAYREFILQGPEKEVLVKGTSAWMVIDMKKKLPLPTRELKFNFPQKGKRHFVELERNFPLSDLEYVDSFKVSDSSIDLNGHVNNTEYVRWAVDSLDNEGIQMKNISDVSMSYISQVFKGEELEIYIGRNDRYHQVTMKDRDREKPAFTMSIS
jgi:acyl-ACP thioesterase